MHARCHFCISFTDDDFSISQRSCSVAGDSGTCMFVWECLKTEGKHLGMCMDGFMFGSCCVHDEEQNQVDQEPLFGFTSAAATVSTTETTIATEPTSASSSTTIKSTRPTRPSRPSKPSHHHVKWPNFHLVQEQQSGNNVESDNVKTSSHFVSVTAPQDPRPTFTTKYETIGTENQLFKTF